MEENNNAQKIVFKKIILPTAAFGVVWYLIPKWPYILLVIIIGFWILILIGVFDFLKKE